MGTFVCVCKQVGWLALGKVQSHEEGTGHLKPLDSWRYGSDQTTWYPGRTTHPGHNQPAGCVWPSLSAQCPLACVRMCVRVRVRVRVCE